MEGKESTTVVATKKKSDDDVHLPDKALYRTAIGALGAYAKARCNLHITRNNMEAVEGRQFIAIANHQSRLDWVFVGLAMWPDLLNVVITQYYYTNPALRVLLKRAGTIGKDQFSPDVTAVKKMMATAKMGGNIMVFPEGRTSPSGRTETFERSIVKLIRHLKLPLIGIRIDGAYLTMPKWNARTRKGRVDVTVEPLLMPEQIAAMSDDEIYDLIVTKLYSDEYKWMENARVKFRHGDDARGLEGVLYRCPKCGAEFSMATDKDKLYCTECGNGARLNKYYELIPFDDGCVIPKNIGDWFDEEKDDLRARIAADPDIAMTGRLTLRQVISKNRWLVPVGEGDARLDKDGFRYIGTRLDEPCEIFIPLAAIPAIAFGPNSSFEIYYNKQCYSFVPKEVVTCQKWSMMGELLHNHYFGGDARN